MKPSWGLPEVWKQCRAKDTKERKGTALGCTISKITLCSGSQNFGRGCSLGSHSSVFQRHRWALAFLIIQTDPDFRAAGKWDLARIQLGKNHITTTTKKNQTPKQNQTNKTGLLDTHWNRVYEDIQHVPIPSKGWDEPGNHLYYTAAAQTTEQLRRWTGSLLGSSSRRSHILEPYPTAARRGKKSR